MTQDYTIDGERKSKDEFFNDVRVIMHEAAHAFYQWEKGRYNEHSPLTNDDRITWMQGYVYAHTQMKENK